MVFFSFPLPLGAGASSLFYGVLFYGVFTSPLRLHAHPTKEGIDCPGQGCVRAATAEMDRLRNISCAGPGNPYSFSGLWVVKFYIKEGCVTRIPPHFLDVEEGDQIRL